MAPRSIFLLTTVVLASCVSAPLARLAEDDLVAENAYDVRKRHVAEGSVVQLTYKVRLEFPRQAINTKHAAMLSGEGWVECSGSPNWEAFVDAANQPSRLTHQSQRVFATRNRLVVAGMQYNSPSGTGRRSSPNNNEQHVVVMIYSLENEEVKQQLMSVFPQCIK